MPFSMPFQCRLQVMAVVPMCMVDARRHVYFSCGRTCCDQLAAILYCAGTSAICPQAFTPAQTEHKLQAVVSMCFGKLVVAPQCRTLQCSRQVMIFCFFVCWSVNTQACNLIFRSRPAGGPQSTLLGAGLLAMRLKVASVAIDMRVCRAHFHSVAAWGQ